MQTLSPRFLALPLIALAVITALGMQAADRPSGGEQVRVKPALQQVAGAAHTLVR